MGLGKTVEVLALVLANPAPASVESGVSIPDSGTGSGSGSDPAAASSSSCPAKLMRVASRATLVVCAVSLVGQWVKEAEDKSAGSLRIHKYHDQNRIRDPQRLATQFDLVVTTYQTLCR